MNKSIKAIIFDFGGVLINWDPRRVFQRFFSDDDSAMEGFMEEIGFAEWNLHQDEGYPFDQAVLDLSTQFPQYAHIIHAYDEFWEDSITGIIPETVEILQRLKKTGYSLYGLTNWNHTKFSLVRHQYAFFNLFDEIIVSGEVKLIKPDPAIYNLLLQKIGLLPSDCLMIDDSKTNIDASKRMGFNTIHFTSPKRLETELIHLNVF